MTVASGPPKASALALGLGLVLLVGLITSPMATNGQGFDGEEQFQAYHHDIGRISGQPNGARVAPQSTIVRQQQQPDLIVASEQTPPIAQPVLLTESRPTDWTPTSGGQSQRQRQATSGGRKPNRITLVVPRPTHSPAPEVVVESAPAPLQPANLPAEHSANFEPLMAQVAAERHQVGGFAGQPAFADRDFAELSQPELAQPAVVAQAVAQPPQAVAHRHQQQVASLGSPLAALSSPNLVQVAPPPQQPQPIALAAQASPRLVNFVNQPEEALEAPSFEHVLGNGCPRVGVFSYENKEHCDRYYMCTNGTFTEEACPNGLSYGTQGAVYQHCAYNWNVQCGAKKAPGPLASPGCPWQFGIFPTSAQSQCSIDYFVCEWGVPETKRCHPEGLFYDDRIKGCQWADQLGCKSEALLNFKCPPEDEDNPFWPYPRYYHTNKDIIVCVNEQPRLVHCTDEQLVEPSSLSCIDIKKKSNKKRL